MELKGYFLKNFKSPIAKNIVKNKNLHNINKLNSFVPKSIDLKVYPDGVMTAINPNNGLLMISFNFGNDWINDLIETQIFNIKRVDKETYVFEFFSTNNEKHFGVTFDSFMNFQIIPISGGENISASIKCRNDITNIPVAFVRNAIYIFNEEEKNYERLRTGIYDVASMCDSKEDENSILLFTANVEGYKIERINSEFSQEEIFHINPVEMVKATVDDGYIFTWVDEEEYILYVGEGINYFYDYGLIGFDTLKTSDDKDLTVAISPTCEINTYNTSNGEFYVIPEIIFDNGILPSFKSLENRIFVREMNNMIYIFSDSIEYKMSCSIYDLVENMLGYNRSLYFRGGTFIRDRISNSIVEDLIYKQEGNYIGIDYISTYKNKLYISISPQLKSKTVIELDSVNYVNNVFMNENYNSDSLIGNIYPKINVNKDFVSVKSDKGVNVSTNPEKCFTNFKTEYKNLIPFRSQGQLYYIGFKENDGFTISNKEGSKLVMNDKDNKTSKIEGFYRW